MYTHSQPYFLNTFMFMFANGSGARVVAAVCAAAVGAAMPPAGYAAPPRPYLSCTYRWDENIDSAKQTYNKKKKKVVKTNMQQHNKATKSGRKKKRRMARRGGCHTLTSGPSALCALAHPWRYRRRCYRRRRQGDSCEQGPRLIDTHAFQ